MERKKQIWEQEIPIPTTVEQVRRERQRQENMKAEEKIMPDTCPHCGCQVFSPFNTGKQIHDVDNCQG